MSVERLPFGKLADGRDVEKIVLHQGAFSAELMTLGATVLSLQVPDQTGKPVDVVLGYRSPAAYMAAEGYVGMLVGRYANRIGGARFFLDGRPYTLAANEGGNQLHGGPGGFSFQLFSAEVVGENAVKFRYTSPDGQGGFPGTLVLEAEYTLTDCGLRLHYQAHTDKPTFCNITNHSYFNLNGSGSVLDHLLWIDADAFTPVDAQSIPVAKAAPVEGTPFDFRVEKPIGQEIGAADEQLQLTKGYDHNYILRPARGLRLAARLRGEKSGIVMETWTDKPGIQLYSGNYLNAARETKSGAPYGPRMAVCLETQFPPDSPNHPEWGDLVLRPGQCYDYTTEYRFA